MLPTFQHFTFPTFSLLGGRPCRLCQACQCWCPRSLHLRWHRLPCWPIDYIQIIQLLFGSPYLWIAMHQDIFVISLVGDPYKPSLTTLTGGASLLCIHSYPQTPPSATCSRTPWVMLLLSNDPKIFWSTCPKCTQSVCKKPSEILQVIATPVDIVNTTNYNAFHKL